MFGGAGIARRCSRSRWRRRSLRPARRGRRAARARSCSGNTPPGTADLRTRLTNVGNNGRLDDLARRAGRGAAEPLARRRARARSGSRGSATGPSPPAQVVDGHSLYYEVRAELGWIGIALLLVTSRASRSAWRSRACGGPGATSTRRSSRRGSALLLHAMVDWDWEMPALFVWFFGAAGAVLAAPARGGRALAPRRGG